MVESKKRVENTGSETVVLDSPRISRIFNMNVCIIYYASVTAAATRRRDHRVARAKVVETHRNLTAAPSTGHEGIRFVIYTALRDPPRTSAAFFARLKKKGCSATGSTVTVAQPKFTGGRGYEFQK